MAFQNIISNLFSKKKDFNYLDDLVNSGNGEVKYRLAQLRNDADSAIYAAEKFIFEQVDTIATIKELLKNPVNLTKQVEQLVAENAKLQKQLEAFEKQQTQ